MRPSWRSFPEFLGRYSRKITRWPSHVTTPRRSPAKSSYTTSEDAADPFGHRWNIAQHLRDVPHDEVVAAA
ncbi:MAG TPA: hypothetical protein VNB91_09985, partial [Jatrophihabitantaceae bacterium]|nr:hypothetical protein [Jatrophihabitantaceae bacterium]